MSKIHKLKTWPKEFSACFSSQKMFEVRKNDRDFKLSDQLVLEEWNPTKEEYTGRILHRQITYILHGGQFGIEEGYVVMALSKI